MSAHPIDSSLLVLCRFLPELCRNLVVGKIPCKKIIQSTSVSLHKYIFICRIFCTKREKWWTEPKCVFTLQQFYFLHKIDSASKNNWRFFVSWCWTFYFFRKYFIIYVQSFMYFVGQILYQHYESISLMVIVSLVFFSWTDWIYNKHT